MTFAGMQKVLQKASKDRGVDADEVLQRKQANTYGDRVTWKVPPFSCCYGGLLLEQPYLPLNEGLFWWVKQEWTWPLKFF